MKPDGVTPLTYGGSAPASDTSTDTSTEDNLENTSSNTIEVPELYTEYVTNEDGSIVTDAEGKNVIKSFGVKYADGTISYTGTGSEGASEASRQYYRAIEYNKYANDNRTRADFATDEEYNSFITVKNIRIGQGAYKYVTNAEGLTTLTYGDNLVISEGTLSDIKKEWGAKSNELNLAITAAQYSPRLTPFGIQYSIQNNPNINSEEEAYTYFYNSLITNKKQLTNIITDLNTKATAQGLESASMSMGFTPLTTIPTFEEFKTNFTFSDNPAFATYKDFAQNVANVVAGKPDVAVPSAPTPAPAAPSTPAPAAPSTPAPAAPSTPAPAPPSSTVFTPPSVVAPAAPAAPAAPSVPLPSVAAPMTGTFVKPTTTSMLGTQPSQANTFGLMTTQPTVGQQSEYDVRMFRNDAGMTTSITFVNGQPSTPIPSGFYPVGSQPAGQTPYTPSFAPTPAPTVAPVTGFKPTFMNQGGAMMPPAPPVQSASVFGGFKPESMQRIASSLGYNENMGGFDQFLNDNPDKKQKMDNYTMKAREMAEGGMAKSFPDLTGDGKVTQADILQGRGVELAYGGAVQKFDNGGTPESTTVNLQQYDTRALAQQLIPQQQTYTGNITDVQTKLAKTPALPSGATVVPVGTQLTAGQLVSPYSGQVTGASALPTTLAATNQAFLPTTQTASLMSPIEASGAIRATADQTQAAQIGQVSQINAEQLAASSVADLEAAQGTEIIMNNPVQRKIETDPVTGESELISGVANAETASKFNEQIQAATADPSKKATVAGQLEGLLQQFEGGNTPAWAAGSMRAATNAMISRGLGASSIAGQAIVQAAMESALPIAQMDAQVFSQFEQQNLSNRQQRAILAAQQRAQFMGQEFDQGFQARVANAAKISDIANMNFTAEQQVALENSRIANTMELSNLSNSQAMIMAEAAALANMDMSNLNNRQQAAVQNAQNFLQADLTNLNNKQSTELFKAQQRIQSLFTDQAALNAAQQFNATSQNQVDQFYASLTNNTSQFNASQANAQAQFNAGQANVIDRFNTEINNQRDQFNAQNRLVIDQANAQWRRQIATADTVAVNRANEINAQSLLGYSQSAYSNLWQYYADNMEWAWTSAENERARISAQAIAQLKADTSISIEKFKEDAAASAGVGGFIGNLLTSDLSNTLAGSAVGAIFPGFG